MLNRQELLTDTRIMLPFWFTIPILSSIFAFFNRPRRPKAKKANATTKEIEQDQDTSQKDARAARERRKAELKGAASYIERKLVPEGSTLKNELSATLDLWNRTLDAQIKDNLTEDVNSLVRDYIRRILKTLKASTFDLPRVENLATTLVDTPGLIKIKNRDALLAYVKLYILQLIKNIN